MFISEQELSVFFHYIYQHVAKEMNINNFEFKTCYELHKEINDLKSELATSLDNFISAYEKWYKASLDFEKVQRSGDSGTQLQIELHEATKNRDETRKKLIDALNFY